MRCDRQGISAAASSFLEAEESRIEHEHDQLIERYSTIHSHFFNLRRTRQEAINHIMQIDDAKFDSFRIIGYNRRNRITAEFVIELCKFCESEQVEVPEGASFLFGYYV